MYDVPGGGRPDITRAYGVKMARHSYVRYLGTDTFSFYLGCPNAATDTLTVSGTAVRLGVCSDHAAGQALILAQYYDQDQHPVLHQAGTWPWSEDACAAVTYAPIGPTRLGEDGELTCPEGHTGPFLIGVLGLAFYYHAEVEGRTIRAGSEAGGGDGIIEGSEFLQCLKCNRLFSVPADVHVEW